MKKNRGQRQSLLLHQDLWNREVIQLMVNGAEMMCMLSNSSILPVPLLDPLSNPVP